MSLINLIMFDGFGIYIWSAFGLSFIGCLTLYINTKREFLRTKNLYLKVNLVEASTEHEISTNKSAKKFILSKDLVINQ